MIRSSLENIEERLRRRFRTAVVGIYLAGVFIWLSNGLPAHAGFASWQALPMPVLRDGLLDGIVHLHAQPPLYNLLLGLLLWVRETLGLPDHLLETIIQILIGGVALVAWGEALRAILRSATASFVILALLLSTPDLYSIITVFFTTWLEFAFLGLALCSAVAVLARPSHGRFAMLALWLGALMMLRPFWHPAIMLGSFALIATARGWRAVVLRRAVIPFACLLAIAVAWPLKNAVVFAEFTYSTWLGYNLDYRNDSELRKFASKPWVDDARAAAHYGDERLARLQESPATSLLWRPLPTAEGDAVERVNMNHYMVPVLNESDKDLFLLGLHDDPTGYALRVADNLLLAFPRPVWPNPYQPYENWVYPTEWHRLTARYYTGYWLGDFINFSLAERLYRLNHVILLVPLALIGGLLAARRQGPARRRLVWLMVCLYTWLLMMTALVDGVESSRFRWPLEPILLGLLALAAQRYSYIRPSVRKLPIHSQPMASGSAEPLAEIPAPAQSR